MRRSRRGLAPLAVAVLVASLVACGGEDRSSDSDHELTGLAKTGARVASDVGCTSCHSVDGSPGIGPTLFGIWGEEVQLTDGRTVEVDESYLERAIRKPRDEVVDGYGPIMPEVSLTSEQVEALIAYIEALD
jgi:cytochrome c oxidase subunit 2